MAPCPGNVLELCAGIGGFSLGLVGGRTVGYVERDAYAAAVLVARMEESALAEAPIWDDLTTFDGKAWRGVVDTIAAGFPCQPFSVAGRRKGTDDERWLWPAIADIIRDVRPRYVFLENVPPIVRHGLDAILGDLAALGFDAEWDLFRASDIGAPQKRERFFLLAHAPNVGGGLDLRTIVSRRFQTTCQGGHKCRPILNPLFVEMLMGFPPGWSMIGRTGFDASATPRCLTL